MKKNNNPDFKNLRVVPSGFQVTIMRRRVSVSKHFPGHSVESYMEAIEHRDKLLRKLPAPLSGGFSNPAPNRLRRTVAV